jgi:hypothetical protein
VKRSSDKQLPSSESFRKALTAYEPVSPRYAAILESWREHSDKGEQAKLWLSLELAAAKRGLAAPQPTDFIGVVLGCTMPAARMNDHSQAVLDRFEKLKLEINKAVEDAEYPLELWRPFSSSRFLFGRWSEAITTCMRRRPAAGRI